MSRASSANYSGPSSNVRLKSFNEPTQKKGECKC
jgi:hypothetical protein